MRDMYPHLDTLPHEWLVTASDQPDYLPLPGAALDEHADLGSMLCDAQVSRGLGDAVAIVHHETGRLITFRELADAKRRGGRGPVRARRAGRGQGRDEGP